MDTRKVRELLSDLRDGLVSVDGAMDRLRGMPYEDIGFAKLDSHRAMRTGFPEVVFCQSKTPEQVVEILARLSRHSRCVLGTRATTETFHAVSREIPGANYNETARVIIVGEPSRPDTERNADADYVMVLCAGTADLPVAEEAAFVAEMMGSRVERAFDVGVAGLHRLLDQKERLFGANVVVAVAGMEGALASVVGGLVNRPVIAVPTSIGYGASFNGLAALLAMLNSCAAGVSVVNIDNGFGAGYLAHLINMTGKTAN